MRDVLPGAVLSGAGVLRAATDIGADRGAYLQKAQSTYGHFATIITILWWFYLQARDHAAWGHS